MNRTVAIDSQASIFYHIVRREIGQVAVAFQWTIRRALLYGNIIVSVDEYPSESLVVHQSPDLRKRQTGDISRTSSTDFVRGYVHDHLQQLLIGYVFTACGWCRWRWKRPLEAALVFSLLHPSHRFWRKLSFRLVEMPSVKEWSEKGYLICLGKC
ncbi:hypothetical protein XU18_3821 [Perkinsela sp. CCAP 1560/4]|nr:hypothetical protein XU18_3821 [Perkinsela sp. CCAP 1560/4]|eukprot:KNH05093.1 hypothetical protein XU18_3821 [Perkinsela sp. CCAP 1560/4]